MVGSGPRLRDGRRGGAGGRARRGGGAGRGVDESAPEPAVEADLEAIPVEEDDAAAEAAAAAAKGDGNESEARENGDWCHAKCGFADIVYAGPNVTTNCHGWGHIVCHHRSSELVNAYWCAPLQCRIDAILQ